MFNELKQRFTIVLIFATFDLEKQIILEIDASDYVIGMCISQLDNKERLRLVIFYLRKMISVKFNYEIYDKKFLVIITTFNKWHIYLREFKYLIKVYVDHRNLLYFIMIKKLNRKQVKWSKTLSSFNFSIFYKKENDNIKTNAFNRHVNHFKDIKTSFEFILRLDFNKTIKYNDLIFINIFITFNQNQER